MGSQRSRPWWVHYEPGVPRELGEAPAALVQGLVESAAADAPGQPAIGYYGQSIRYAELEARASAAAAAFRRDGVGPGSSVWLDLPNCPAWLVAALGVLKAGGRVLSLLGGGAGEEPVCHPEPRPRTAVLADPVTALRLKTERSPIRVDPGADLPLGLRWLRRLVGGGRRHHRGPGAEDTRRWEHWLASEGGEGLSATLSPNDAAWQVLGLPPQPCGGAFTHGHIVAAGQQLADWLTDARPAQDSWLILCALGTPFGLGVLAAAFQHRANLILVPGWRARDVGDALRFAHPAYVWSDAQAVQALAEDPQLARFDCRSVRAWITDDAVDPESQRAFVTLSGLDLCVGLGLPGVAGLAACNPVNGRRDPGSYGIPLPGVDLRLGGEAGHPEGPAIRGPNVASEGWMPLTRPLVWDANGFLCDPAPDSPAPRA